jgi:hypothetical protein
MKHVLTRRAALVPVLIFLCFVAGIGGVRFALLAQTRAALVRGEKPAMCLYFADAIDSAAFETFLAKTVDNEAKSFVICLLGWKHRAESVDYLRSLEAEGRPYSRHATLSIVAIEKRIPFPGKDFAEEFYREYAAKAVRLAKTEGIPLRDAAVRVAEEWIGSGGLP